MKNIQFKNEDYQVPQSWDEVTLKMIMESDRLNEIVPEIPLLTIVSAYTGIPLKKITSASAHELEPLLDDMDFLYTPYSATPINHFRFNDETYLTKENILDEPFSTWVSIQTILYNYKDDPVKGLARMIAVLCKKENETIDDFDLNDRARLFENLPITIAKNIESFFLNSQKMLSISLDLFSNQEKLKEGILQQCQELKDIMKKYVEQNGGSWLMRLRIGFYQIYLWYLTHLLERYFSSIPTESSKKKWKQMLKKFYIKKPRKK